MLLAQPGRSLPFFSVELSTPWSFLIVAVWTTLVRRTGVLMSEIRALWDSRVHHVKTQWEKHGPQPKRGPSLKPKLGGTLTLDFQSPELWEIHFCCSLATQSIVLCNSRPNGLMYWVSNLNPGHKGNSDVEIYPE